MTPAERAAAGFLETYGTAPCITAVAPGRVNLIGEHTDYQGGLVLPVAADLRTAVAAGPAGGGIVKACSGLFPDPVSFDPGSLSPGNPIEGWGRYVAGIAWALYSSGMAVPGADIYIESDIPPGSGLSSSAALEVAVGMALSAMAGSVSWDESSLRSLAGFCQLGENEYCGVPCGSMDHLAACLGVSGSALLLDCRTLEASPVPIPGDLSIVVCDSGERHDLSTAGYPGRQAEAAAALASLGTRRPEVQSLRDAVPEDLVILEEALAAAGAPASEAVRLVGRARHIIEENRRVRLAAEALGRGDGASMGRLIRESHDSLRDLYGVSTPGLDALVEAAMALPGCFGARLTGGGFGGSVVCLVETGGVEGFLAAMSAFLPGGARLVRPSGGAAIERIG